MTAGHMDEEQLDLEGNYVFYTLLFTPSFLFVLYIFYSHDHTNDMCSHQTFNYQNTPSATISLRRQFQEASVHGAETYC